jgi:hypothetical protein
MLALVVKGCPFAVFQRYSMTQTLLDSIESLWLGLVHEKQRGTLMTWIHDCVCLEVVGS